MNEARQFLELSTIHGLYHVSISKKQAKFFWILVIIGGFSGSEYLIYESFFHWKESPISTTIETLPISQITFPNITVCPPKHSLLNLNPDFLTADKVEIDEENRKEIIDIAVSIIQEYYYKVMMKNLSKLEYPDRAYNWYHGYTVLEYPYWSDTYDELKYDVTTSATSGNISTQHFGNEFDTEKVDEKIEFRVSVYVPEYVFTNTTLFFNIIKNTIYLKVDFSDKQYERLKICGALSCNYIEY